MMMLKMMIAKYKNYLFIKTLINTKVRKKVYALMITKKLYPTWNAVRRHSRTNRNGFVGTLLPILHCVCDHSIEIIHSPSALIGAIFLLEVAQDASQSAVVALHDGQIPLLKKKNQQNFYPNSL